MALLPLIREIWLECTVSVLVWLVLPTILVANQRVGLAAVVSVIVALAWTVVSFCLLYWSAFPDGPKRDGQAYVSLLWLASVIGALSSIAFAAVLLLIWRGAKRMTKVNE